MSHRIILAAVVGLAVASTPHSARAQDRPYLLDGLVVTASPTPRAAGDVARSVTVLDGAELRARGHSLLSEALRDVPGISVVRGGSFGAVTSVFMRGGESDYVQVLVDGVQVNSPGGAFDFAGLTLDNVERVEVVRGPASSLYGSDAVAGVIHVITRAGRGAPEGSLSLRGGSYGAREAALSLMGGDGSAGWSLGLFHLRTEGILPVNNGFENSVVSGSVRLAPDTDTRATLSLRLGDRKYRFPTDGTGAIVDENAFTFGDEVSAALSASRRVARGLEVQGSVALARTGSGTDDQPDGVADTAGYYGFTSLDHVQRATADVRAHLSRGGFVTTVGVEVEDQEQRSFSESLSEWGPTAGRNEHERWNRAAYAHVTGVAGSRSFAVGGRIEDNERFGRMSTWNTEVGWQADAAFRLRAGAGVAMKEPTFFENFAQGWVRGNPDLAPERARSVEAGFEGALAAGRVGVRGTVFHQRFRDLIQYVAVPSVPGEPNFANVAEASSRGVEMGSDLRVGPVRATIDWTWLDTEVLEGGVDDGSDADFAEGWRLLRRPSHTVQMSGSLDVAGGTVTAHARVVGERDDRDFSTWPARRVALPRYTHLGLGVDVPVGRGVRVGVRADNLLGASYEEVVGFPAPGRAFSAGARVTFGGSN